LHVQLESKLPSLRTLAEMHGMVKAENIRLAPDFNITINMDPPPDWRGHRHDPVVDITPPHVPPPPEQDEAEVVAKQLYDQVRTNGPLLTEAEKRALEVLRHQPRSGSLKVSMTRNSPPLETKTRHSGSQAHQMRCLPVMRVSTRGRR
jgi:hypothetical protein